MSTLWPQPINGSATHSPQVMSGYLDPDYLYGVHVTWAGGAVAFRWRRSTGVMQTFDLSTISGNPLDLPVYDLADEHYALAVGVDDQDHVFITGNHHEDNSSPTTTHVVECSNVGAFTTAGSWAAASTSHYDELDSEAGASPGVYCYHHFERLTSGVLLHFLTQSELTTSSEGRDLLAFKRTAGTWSAVVGDGHFATTTDTNDTPSLIADRVYCAGVVVEADGGGTGVDRVHVCGYWRTNDADQTSQQAPWYVYADSTALGTWYYKQNGGDGTMSMPITWGVVASPPACAITSAPSTSEAVWMPWVDPATHYPALLVANGASTAPCKRLTWSGTAWTSADETGPANGERREFTIHGERWIRANLTNRVYLYRVSDALQVKLGGSVLTTGTNYSPNPCPVWLRELDIFAVNVGEGDTPKVITFGDGYCVH